MLDKLSDRKLCFRTSGCHTGGYEEFYLLGYNTV
jgi:hypothetical protein